MRPDPERKSICPRDAALAHLGVGVAFIALGMTQPAFLGVGCAFLGLAIGAWRRRG